MSDATFENAPPPTVFVPRESQAAVIAAALAAVRNTEGERRWGIAIGRLSGWFVAAMMVVPLSYALSIIKNRPVPQDRIWVAIMHSDLSTEEAKPVEDITPSQKEAATAEFMFNYVDYRVSYSWETVQNNYDRTRYVTVGAEQKNYIDEMTERPERLTIKLGKYGEQRVKVGSPSRIDDEAFEVPYTLQIKSKEGVWSREMSCRARISYTTLPSLPPEVARHYDPLKLVVTRYDPRPATPDPTTLCGSLPR